jgi:hypothetical protein
VFECFVPGVNVGLIGNIRWRKRVIVKDQDPSERFRGKIIIRLKKILLVDINP